MRKSDPDSIEVAIAGLVGLTILLAGSYLLEPLRDRKVEEPREVKTLNELRPSLKYWYAEVRDE